MHTLVLEASLLVAGVVLAAHSKGLEGNIIKTLFHNADHDSTDEAQISHADHDSADEA